MIVRPDQDGPPDLSEYFNSSSRYVGTLGEPISVATGRALLASHGGDAATAVNAALEKALNALGDVGQPQLCHCTYSLDVDVEALRRTLQQCFSSSLVPIIARSVNKKDSPGTVEVLLLRSGSAAGAIQYAESFIASRPMETSAPSEHQPSLAPDGMLSPADLRTTAVAAAKAAAAQAIRSLPSPDGCTFLIFAHAPACTEPTGQDPKDDNGRGMDDDLVWSMESAIREGLNAASEGVIAYGGPAVGEQESGKGWTLVTGSHVYDSAGSVSDCKVCVAAVSGSISFLISSVVKNWVQPKYTEPLSFMVPTYVDDASRDLLTAIRYDDWDKFIWCLEDQKVDVNTIWTDKQSQSPLLAACARARTRMLEYLIAKGADVQYRNAGNFTAAMYTRKLTEYDPPLVLAQLRTLEDAGLDTVLSPADEKAVRDSGDGRIFLENVRKD